MKQTAITINKEYEALVPPMSEQDYLTLKKSIKENGQQEPIIVNSKGVVLDGHNRLKACKELNLKPNYETRQFEDINQEKWFLIEVNLNRRHLNDFQRVSVALTLKPIYEQMARKRMSEGGKGRVLNNEKPLHTDKELAQMAKVSTGTLHKVQKILEADIDGEKLRKAQEGKLSISKVYTHVKRAEAKRKFMESPRKIELPLGVKLFNEDFRLLGDKIPDASIDLIFTDPPYLQEYIPIYKDLGVFANRVLKPGGSLVSYIGQMWLPEIIQHFQNAGLTYWWMYAIRMHGPSARMRVRKAFQQWKPLLWFVKGDKLATEQYVWDFIEDSKTPEKALHEWEQSVNAAKSVIRPLTFETSIICDPMMGSGTTGIAALDLKRQFIGVEIDKERFNVGQSRIFDFINENGKPFSSNQTIRQARKTTAFDLYLSRLQLAFATSSA